MDKYKQLLNMFYEVGQLKREKRAGWVLLGIPNPETVGEHISRSVFIAFALAKLEGADPYKAALISAFHELPETRIGDTHKTAQRYLNKKEAEKKVMEEQFEAMPEEIASELKELIFNFGEDRTKEQVVARDADFVECAIQAKEYLEQGYSQAQNWIDNCNKCIKTASGKKIMDLLEDSDSQDWYRSLKKIRRDS